MFFLKHAAGTQFPVQDEEADVLRDRSGDSCRRGGVRDNLAIRKSPAGSFICLLLFAPRYAVMQEQKGLIGRDWPRIQQTSEAQVF